MARRLGRRGRRDRSLRARRLTLATGLLLPIWGKLPSKGCSVRRVRAPDGRRWLGRVLDEVQAASLKTALGLTEVGDAWADGGRTAAAVLDRNVQLALSGGLWLKRSRVMDRWRLEVVGGRTDRDALVALGCFVEIIAFRRRLFPVGGPAAKGLEEGTERASAPGLARGRPEVPMSNPLDDLIHDIIAHIEAGVPPWRQAWKPAPIRGALARDWRALQRQQRLAPRLFRRVARLSLALLVHLPTGLAINAPVAKGEKASPAILYKTRVVGEAPIGRRGARRTRPATLVSCATEDL